MPPYGTLLDRMLYYTKKLEENKKYVLCVWNPHCRIGTWGHNVYPSLMDAFTEWEKKRFGIIDYVTKGSNIFTEHYSGVQADVPDPEDPTTQLNTSLIQTLENADVILLSGQALSHCVANTARDIFKNFGSDSLKKVTILIDTTSPVPGFEQMAEDFVKEATGMGVNIAKSTDVIL
jgi:nicotinamidase/pyrazinamidase